MHKCDCNSIVCVKQFSAFGAGKEISPPALKYQTGRWAVEHWQVALCLVVPCCVVVCLKVMFCSLPCFIVCHCCVLPCYAAVVQSNNLGGGGYMIISLIVSLSLWSLVIYPIFTNHSNLSFITLFYTFSLFSMTHYLFFYLSWSRSHSHCAILFGPHCFSSHAHSLTLTTWSLVCKCAYAFA